MCFSLAELLIPEGGFVCLCVWLLYEVMAAGSWQDVALMKESFQRGPISVYSQDNQCIELFAKFQPFLLIMAPTVHNLSSIQL